MLFVARVAPPSAARNQKSGEIDVERINVMERDARFGVVISNEARRHPGIANGKAIKRTRPRLPGMLFFEPAGDKMGRLIFGGNGGKGHFGSLTFDTGQGDQTIGCRHLESDDGAYSTALEMWQRLGLARPELEVLGLVVEGLINREIAGRLFVSENTVKTHVAHALGNSGRGGAPRPSTRRGPPC
ncbi:MAG TPA: helix-turn-helix transcriptional regulator [Candidatus Saccharimonadales bacterium]|nr:helix-turn-helix transcriptional regulator [Candidatus Saccharimonadales bacterium]